MKKPIDCKECNNKKWIIERLINMLNIFGCSAYVGSDYINCHFHFTPKGKKMNLLDLPEETLKRVYEHRKDAFLKNILEAKKEWDKKKEDKMKNLFPPDIVDCFFTPNADDKK